MRRTRSIWVCGGRQQRTESVSNIQRAVTKNDGSGSGVGGTVEEEQLGPSRTPNAYRCAGRKEPGGTQVHRRPLASEQTISSRTRQAPADLQQVAGIPSDWRSLSLLPSEQQEREEQHRLTLRREQRQRAKERKEAWKGKLMDSSIPARVCAST